MSLGMTHHVRFLLRSSLQGLLALTVLVNSRAQDTSRQSTIARIEGKYTISSADVQQYLYDSHLIYKYRKNRAKAYQLAVDGKIVHQLKLIDFFALGLDKNAQLLQGIRREISEELVVRYYETQFYERYVNEDSMKSAYRELGKEVVYQQIVFAKSKSPSQKELKSLRSLARSVKDTIGKGADFAQVAKNYSQPGESSRPGDLMPPLTWKLSLLSNLNSTIFHLPADEVRIIESKESIFIVKVVAVRNTDVPPYENVKEDIRRALDQRYADQSLREFEETKKNLIDDKTLAWNTKALQQLQRWSSIPHFYESGFSDTLRNAISRGKNLVIVRYAKSRVDFSEYLRLLNDVLRWGTVSPITQDNIKKYILEAVRTDILVKRANALNLEKDIIHAQTKNPVLRNEILRLYDLHEIEARIPAATDKALKDFYEAHKDSLFYQLAKVNLYAVIDSSKKVVEEAKHRFEQNTPFEKLAPEIFVKTYVQARDGSFDTFLADEPPYLADVAFKLKLYETAGPIEYVDTARGRQYAFVKCVGIREAKQLSFQDVKPTISTAFTKYYRDEITRATEDRLRKKYTVTVYTDVLNRELTAVGINQQ
jgi:hypothetical protein